jgi:hypothetical protein
MSSENPDRGERRGKKSTPAMAARARAKRTNVIAAKLAQSEQPAPIKRYIDRMVIPNGLEVDARGYLSSSLHGRGKTGLA